MNLKEFRVEYWGQQNHTSEVHNLYQDCHYRGRLQNHLGHSDLALSNCNGLNGIIQIDQNHYLIGKAQTA